MSNTIKPKRSNTANNVPTTSNLSSGEMAVNMADQKAYINNGTSIVQFASGKLSGLGDVTLSGLTTGQTISWNGTAWVNGSGGSMTYPGAGIPNSTGSAWGTSYSVTGTGNVVLSAAPTISGEWGNFDGIKFNTSPSITPTAGEIFWNSTQQAPEVKLDSNVQGTITQDSFFYVKASSAITKGQVCMFTGSVGASGVLTAAPASGNIDGLIIMGVAAESIALNGFGYIQSSGTLQGLNTNSFTAGAILYYDPTVTGGLTTTQPAKNQTQTVVAACVNSNPSNGSIFVRLTYFPEFGDLGNVSFSGVATNNLIQYNGTNWVNVAPSSVAGVGSVANSITPGTGISGSAFNGSAAQTWNLANTAVTAGSYTYASITVDAQGRLTSASNGTAPVTSVSGTAPISSSGGTTPAISISQATTSTNGYLSSTDWNTFNNKGSGSVTSVGTGTGLTGGTITTTGTISLANTAVTAGSYTNANITVDAQGRLTSASNGSGGSGTVTSVSGTGTVAGISLSGTVTTSGSLSLGGTFALPSGQVPTKMIYDTFTANGSTTSFSSTNTYTSGKIEVYCNGVKMRNGTDVTVTSGTAVVFATAPANTSLIDLVYPI